MYAVVFYDEDGRLKVSPKHTENEAYASAIRLCLAEPYRIQIDAATTDGGLLLDVLARAATKLDPDLAYRALIQPRVHRDNVLVAPMVEVTETADDQNEGGEVCGLLRDQLDAVADLLQHGPETRTRSETGNRVLAAACRQAALGLGAVIRLMDPGGAYGELWANDGAYVPDSRFERIAPESFAPNDKETDDGGR